MSNIDLCGSVGPVDAEMIEQAEIEFRSYLASQKLKYTPERRRIFKEIFDSTGHFGADELYIRLKGAAREKSVSRATVYRTLDLLARLGLVRKICLGDRSSMYENVVDWKRHGHLICISCGNIQEFKIPNIEEILEGACKEFDFAAQNRCIQISGHCHECVGSKLLSIGSG